MESVFLKNAERIRFKELYGDIKTDVLVVGGGIAGILCAYMLKDAGVESVVVEAGEILGGVTKNTTAKITCLHGAVFDKMIKRFGKERAHLFYKAQNMALLEYKKLCKEIRCDFKLNDSFVYSLNDREKIEREVLALNSIGCKASFEKNLPLPFETCGAVKVENQAEFNPLKFLYAISKDLSIYENTRVLEITPFGAVTDRGKITADKIIVASHFPFINKYGGFFLKMYQHRSYVMALEGAENVNGMYVDEDSRGMSFRNYNGLLLVGGAGHRTGKSGGGYGELRDFLKKYYPKAKEVCRWATQDCITLDDIAYIGRYSKMVPNMYVATGFNKWGMTNAMVSAMLLCDLVRDRKNEFSQVFSPQRSILRPQLAVNISEAFLGLITPTAPRCPHLGCALKYNRLEHSWDCSCHGSRFASDGKLLNNPATKNKNFYRDAP